MGRRRHATISGLRGNLAVHWIHNFTIYRDRLVYITLSFFDRFRRESPKRLTTVLCTTFPNSDSVEYNSLYITQVGHLQKWVSFRCPGNCSKIVRLQLSSTASPHWTIITDWLGRITVNPSIRQQTTCRCHFWIRRSCIRWCADMPPLRDSYSATEFNPSPSD